MTASSLRDRQMLQICLSYCSCRDLVRSEVHDDHETRARASYVCAAGTACLSAIVAGTTDKHHWVQASDVQGSGTCWLPDRAAGRFSTWSRYKDTLLLAALLDLFKCRLPHAYLPDDGSRFLFLNHHGDAVQVTTPSMEMPCSLHTTCSMTSQHVLELLSDVMTGIACAGQTLPVAAAPKLAESMHLASTTKLNATYLNFLRGELAQAHFSYSVKVDPPSEATPLKPAIPTPKPKVYEALSAMPALAAP